MPTAEHLILRELLARDPDWVSGSALATKLGVSRVAIDFAFGNSTGYPGIPVDAVMMPFIYSVRCKPRVVNSSTPTRDLQVVNIALRILSRALSVQDSARQATPIPSSADAPPANAVDGAVAREMATVCNLVIPVRGSNRGALAAPPSMTTRTPMPAELAWVKASTSPL